MTWRIGVAPGSDLVVQPGEGRLGGPAVAERGALNGDGGVGLDAAGDPGRRADDGVVADDRLAAEDRGVGVDDDLVLDRRVPLDVAEDLAGGLVAGEAQGAEGDALEQLHAVADP